MLHNSKGNWNLAFTSMELTVQQKETDTEQAIDKLITNGDQCNEENEMGL